MILTRKGDYGNLSLAQFTRFAKAIIDTDRSYHTVYNLVKRISLGMSDERERILKEALSVFGVEALLKEVLPLINKEKAIRILLEDSLKN
jgi:hypothetical protein